MNERYDTTAARHFAAFRPPLHGLILGRVLEPTESFATGLDVGCGTGRSTVALAKYCGRVLGLDPSRSMLDAAQLHPRVSYLHGSGDALDGFPPGAIDLVTFAGSLFYAKSPRLRREMARVCAPGGTVVAYDFEILLDDLLGELGVECPAVASDYDHRANLEGWAEFAPVRSGEERLRLEVEARGMAHILLSDSNRCDALSRRFRTEDPFDAVVQHLLHSRRPMPLEAVIYFSRYRLEEFRPPSAGDAVVG